MEKNKYIKCHETSYYSEIKLKRYGNKKNKLYIGKYCSISKNLKVFLGGNHRYDWITTYPFNILDTNFNYITGHPISNGDVIIENDVWIGESVTIMSGITIGDGAVIGAHSVVTKNVNPYEIVGGNPAKLIKKRFSNNNIKKLLKIKWWDLNEETIKKLIPFLLSSNINEFFEKVANEKSL